VVELTFLHVAIGAALVSFDDQSGIPLFIPELDGVHALDGFAATVLDLHRDQNTAIGRLHFSSTGGTDAHWFFSLLVFHSTTRRAHSRVSSLTGFLARLRASCFSLRVLSCTLLLRFIIPPL
jgi:hypothetical protein